jgi:gluconate 5-dehydrogenase
MLTSQNSNPFSLQNHRALITGSSGGIGLALARALGQAGATVVLNGRDSGRLQTAQAALVADGLSVELAVFDVTDADAVRVGVADIEQRLGAIDILVNNAGMQIRNPLHEFADDDWHRLMRTNLDSVFYVSKAGRPA